MALMRPVFFLILFASIPMGFYFESVIKMQYYPEYDAVLYECGVVFISGLIYSLITKSYLVILITISCTFAIPYLHKWIVQYWAYNPIF